MYHKYYQYIFSCLKDNNARILKSEAESLEMINFISSFRAKKIMINDVLKYSSSTALQISI